MVAYLAPWIGLYVARLSSPTRTERWEYFRSEGRCNFWLGLGLAVVISPTVALRSLAAAFTWLTMLTTMRLSVLRQLINEMVCFGRLRSYGGRVVLPSIITEMFSGNVVEPGSTRYSVARGASSPPELDDRLALIHERGGQR